MTAKTSSDAAERLAVWDRIALVGFSALHWRQRLALTFLRAQRATLPTRYLRWLTRRISTGEAVWTYCSKHNIPHRAVTLDGIAAASSFLEQGVPAPTLHFLDVPAAERATGCTLLYFHGGGFVNPLRGAAHMPFIVRCAETCQAKQAVVLEYALAPEYPYPAQLVQCIEALRYLLYDMQLQPENLVLAGDSAGGQLVGALLAHLVTPSPYAAPMKIEGHFRAALFVSPFVRLPPSSDGGSYVTNHRNDYLTRPQVWANLCGVGHAKDVWNLVFARDSQGLVRKTMITVGTSEVFLDCCRLFAKEYMGVESIFVSRDGDHHLLRDKDFVLVECESEAHVQVALDSVVGYNNGAMHKAIMSWLAGL
ncbi:Alpha/Beta hydrolase protein [Corynascus novoguineensis]|uniref:Alpha/Beta hydrolase protein n=1 Tax=Corynascus novoguineensis TaxID=1126955 RepID=A0AAN7HBH9_9PEZI|nr:Alpha/Beta hydrolase protein [Corynascus novoguineensis]